jgi:hypothetical protein
MMRLLASEQIIFATGAEAQIDSDLASKISSRDVSVPTG